MLVCASILVSCLHRFGTLVSSLLTLVFYLLYEVQWFVLIEGFKSCQLFCNVSWQLKFPYFIFAVYTRLSSRSAWVFL